MYIFFVLKAGLLNEGQLELKQYKVPSFPPPRHQRHKWKFTNNFMQMQIL